MPSWIERLHSSQREEAITLRAGSVELSTANRSVSPFALPCARQGQCMAWNHVENMHNAHLQVVILDNDRTLSKITTGRYLG